MIDIYDGYYFLPLGAREPMNAGIWSHIYSAVDFLSPGYVQKRGVEHPAYDLNWIEGGNSDLGANVYAMADGLVVLISAVLSFCFIGSRLMFIAGRLTGT